MEEIHK